MTHLIKFEGGEKYCTLCGTSDFSTACKYNKELIETEYTFRERELLMKEKETDAKVKEADAKVKEADAKEIVAGVKVKEAVVKENEVLMKKDAIQSFYVGAALVFLLFFLALYIVFAGFRDLRTAVIDVIAVCNKGEWLAVANHLVDKK